MAASSNSVSLGALPSSTLQPTADTAPTTTSTKPTTSNTSTISSSSLSDLLSSINFIYIFAGAVVLILLMKK